MNGGQSHPAGARANRLIREKSPYLLQHAHNPVDWYPWGPEALAAARQEDKPIFLSIGYSTCHWCHVMARESFEDREVAALMNDAFINIKVDREERPDLDSVYMTAAQLLSGGGGWPLNIILTPDQRPFYAATYLPKHSRLGRAGIMDLVPRIKDLWRSGRDKIASVAGQVTAALDRPLAECGGEAPGEATLQAAFDQLASMHDPKNGGFGQAPKFPTPHNITFLLRCWKRFGDPRALEMAEAALQAMRRGGIWDHAGFGFHRYATDERWLVPHFEKMLYDQALLATAYTEAWQATGDEAYARTVGRIFTYVLRDMTSPEGAFYSAEDADSEGVEGKFYVWTEAEIREVLAPADADLLIEVMAVSAADNVPEGPGLPPGANILHLPRPLRETAARLKMRAGELERKLDAALAELYGARASRVRPHQDDKVLADWNGLMISALARAAAALNEPAYAEAAAKAASFVLDKMTDGQGRLFHRWRGGEAAVPGFLDDYVFMVRGLTDLYEAVFDPLYLRTAVALNRIVAGHFQDAAGGGFFQTADDAEAIIARHKDAYDGAVPSGNSVAMMNLLRIGRLTADPALERMAEGVIRAFYCAARKAPAGFTELLSALDFALGPSAEVVIAGAIEAPDTVAMIRALRGAYVPNKVLLLRPPGRDSTAEDVMPEFVQAMAARGGKATAYVCRNFNCAEPVTDPRRMVELLENVPAQGG
ncbi:MAG TPA: thioredoxin domain-containing protein [bacterium]|nr:thioredoxin domain-containing protein [bacterium]